MAIINSFFDNFANSNGPKVNLGDYQHASRLYVSNNMRLAPKFKHLYHVVLNINPQAQDLAKLVKQIDKRELNILARYSDLPKYDIQTETVNQYNRKKIIQTGVRYNPINIEFHDDNAGVTSLFWEAYFRYYYSDSNYTEKNADGTPKLSVDAYGKVSGNLNSMYGNSDSQVYKFGLDRPNKPQNFFTSIQIFQLHPQWGKSAYTSYTLINPYIASFQHDSVSQENSEFSINRFSVEYEAVQYNRGYTAIGNAPAGFAETHYDKTPSSLSINDASGLLGVVGTIAGAANSIPELQRGNYQFNYVDEQNKTYLNTKELSLASKFTANQTIVEPSLGNASFPGTSLSTVTTETTQKTF